MSTIKIYNTKITPERNAKVDEIETYLASLTPAYSNNDFQYLRIELRMSVDVNIGQEYSGGKLGIGNYVRINQDSRNYYFFVKQSHWKSQNCVSLELWMDTVNTFSDIYSLDKKTLVQREHRDRFVKLAARRKKLLKTEIQEAGEHRYSFTYLLNGVNPRIIPDSLDIQPEDTVTDVVHKDVIQTGNTVQIYFDLDQIYAGHEITISLTYTVETVRRNIDITPEGIEPVLFKKYERFPELFDARLSSDNRHLDWYLIYGKDANSKLHRYLCPSEPIRANVTNRYSQDWKLSEISDGYYYLDFATIYEATPASAKDGHHIEIWGVDAVGNEVALPVSGSSPDRTPTAKCGGLNTFENRSTVIALEKRSGRLYYNYKYYASNADSYWWTSNDPNYAVSTDIVKLRFKAAKGYQLGSFVIYSTGNHWYNLRSKIRTGIQIPFNNSVSTTVTLKSFSELETHTLVGSGDNQSEAIIKIIKLPYCPIKIAAHGTSSSTLYTLDNEGLSIVNAAGHWADRLLQLADTAALSTTIWLYEQDNFDHLREDANPLDIIRKDVDITVGLNDARHVVDTKIYNSEFTQYRLTYDNFNFIYQLELLDNTGFSYDMRIEYTVSAALNRNWLAHVHFLDPKLESIDYSEYFMVDTNNEMPVLTNSYLEYMRNGYNYDVKNQQLSNAQTAVGIGTTALGIVLSAIPGTQAVGIPTIMGGITTTTTGIIGSAQRENSMQQKLNELRKQQPGVSGSNDISLSSFYTNNKINLNHWTVNESMHNKLDDLFYYCGYRTDEQKVPDLNSRYWFNFIQCEPVFNFTQALYNDYVEDLKERFKAGVTVYHRHTTPWPSEDDNWDWGQVNENWEVSLLS